MKWLWKRFFINFFPFIFIHELFKLYGARETSVEFIKYIKKGCFCLIYLLCFD